MRGVGNVMQAPDLIIFDCDGVLIDSEMLSCRALCDALREYGVDVTLDEVMQRCIGHSEAHTLAEFESRYKITFPPEYLPRKRELTAQAFEKELKAMTGIADFIGKLHIKKCVASGSRLDRLEHSLGLVGLWDHFAPHIFSATQVAKGKPAPDLFLFAAQQMGVAPEQCLVIEDSIAGVQAAKAAAMRVYGFTGGEHCDAGHGQRLMDAGAERVFDHMDQIAQALT